MFLDKLHQCYNPNHENNVWNLQYNCSTSLIHFKVTRVIRFNCMLNLKISNDLYLTIRKYQTGLWDKFITLKYFTVQELWHCTTGEVVIFSHVLQFSILWTEFLYKFLVKSWIICAYEKPLFMRIPKMSLLLHFGPPRVELWPSKHLKSSLRQHFGLTRGKIFLLNFTTLF